MIIAVEGIERAPGSLAPRRRSRRAPLACMFLFLFLCAPAKPARAESAEDYALLYALSAGDTSAVGALLDRHPRLLRRASGYPEWNPLQRAVADGDRVMVEFLLGRRPDLEAADSQGARPLHLAVRRREDTTDVALAVRRGIQEALLAAGARVTATDSRGATPLHWAATHGDTGFARLLIEHGADVKLLARSAPPR